jgi:hypothetical protein
MALAKLLKLGFSHLGLRLGHFIVLIPPSILMYLSKEKWQNSNTATKYSSPAAVQVEDLDEIEKNLRIIVYRQVNIN